MNNGVTIVAGIKRFVISAYLNAYQRIAMIESIHSDMCYRFRNVDAC